MEGPEVYCKVQCRDIWKVLQIQLKSNTGTNRTSPSDLHFKLGNTEAPRPWIMLLDKWIPSRNQREKVAVRTPGFVLPSRQVLAIACSHTSDSHSHQRPSMTQSQKHKGQTSCLYLHLKCEYSYNSDEDDAGRDLLRNWIDYSVSCKVSLYTQQNLFS